SGTADSAAADMAYLPTLLSIRAQQLTVDGRQLNHVVAGASRDGLNWRANIDAEELNGYIEFRQPGTQGAGRVYARLSRLSLAASQASEVEALLDEPPTSIPALDIVVENMELRGRKLGRVEIDAVNRSAAAPGGGREWRLNKFNILLPEATLTASGSWGGAPAGAPRSAARPRSERRRAVMDFRLDIADSGELLKRFGMPGVIRRGKGRLEGQVAWSGSPLSLDYPSLNGQFNVNVESGQFMKADPGIAKLLGVLSLQSLPRRLTLDFRDVFSQGFAFDFVRGDVTIAQGVAQTGNLRMSGVNAAVLMDGSADLARETQHLKVVVVPELDAGTASLIATVINPAIGLGSFLAQLFLRRPLTEAATQEFQIDGTWSDPKITKIDRKARARAQTGDAESKETR
ncbi:MAG: AsmA-like C-terminal region-containing protein, partial [Polaromonas sp.]